MPERTWQRTHTETADNGRETKRKKQKIKLKRYRMHGWRWTDGQKDREQDKERDTGGVEFRLYKGQCETMPVNMYVI